MDRYAQAVWKGALKDGSGTLDTQSGVFSGQPYSFKTRFEDERGTSGTIVLRGACPHDCPDTCATLVEVRDGRAVSFRADPDHPFTQGWLCAKVRRRRFSRIRASRRSSNSRFASAVQVVRTLRQ